MSIETSAKVTRRAFAIHIDNPAVGIPVVTFEEEKLIEIDGELIHKPLRSSVVQFDPNEAEAVELYNLLKNYYINNVLNKIELTESLESMEVTEVLEAIEQTGSSVAIEQEEDVDG